MMMQYAMFALTTTGSRDLNEDRIEMRTITTNGGLVLQVGIVCDGMGGIAGEVAAQLTVDVILNMLINSYDMDVIQIMNQAIHMANYQVYETVRGGWTTVALAIIHQDQSSFGRLYVGGVGNCRVGLIRSVNQKGKLQNDRKVRWLNRPHTVAEDAIWESAIDARSAYQLPNYHAITRVIGKDTNVEFDYGLYNQADTIEQALKRGYRGIELMSSDTIVICSDGVSDINDPRQTTLQDQEFVEYALVSDARDALYQMMRLIETRHPSDNASLGLLLVDPDSPLRKKSAQSRKTSTLFYGVIFSLIIAILGLGFAIATQKIDMATFFAQEQFVESISSQTEVAIVTEARLSPTDISTLESTSTSAPTMTSTLTPTMTATSAPTATATSTLPPTTSLMGISSVIQPIINGQIGYKYYNDMRDYLPVMLGEPVQSNRPFMLEVVHADMPSQSASLYGLQGTKVNTVDVDIESLSLSMDSSAGSKFIIESGVFKNQITVNMMESAVNFNLYGACALIDHQQYDVGMTCYSGDCQFNIGGSADDYSVSVGDKVIVDILTDNFKIVSASSSEVLNFSWIADWNPSASSICNLESYIDPLVSTVTVSPTPVRSQSTAIPPTATRVSSTPVRSQSTAIPPTATRVSSTPVRSQSTAIPPTATRVPSTPVRSQSTAIPPTATRVSSTPVRSQSTAIPPTATRVSPTPVRSQSTAIPPTATRVPPTAVPWTPIPPTSDYNWSTSTPVPPTPVPPPTRVPPTETRVPPTPVPPPTSVPSPTDVPPPTPVPPTPVPPTPVPPTPVPPTPVPPTPVPPTPVPPTPVPPTPVPPTPAPPTDEPPPTDVPWTDVPPTDEPPPTDDSY